MGLQVLVVDDSAIARSVVRRSLKICGLSDAIFLEARSGNEALAILRSQNIDLVFTDLNMPDMGGEGLLKRMKASPKLFNIPVVIISSMSNKAKGINLISEHASAVLQKPINLPQISQILEETLKIF